MKKLFSLIILLVSASLFAPSQVLTTAAVRRRQLTPEVAAQSPAPATAKALAGYPNVRTDQNITQLPNPMPKWGGANGCGTNWVNQAFPSSVYTRITCASDTLNHDSLQTSDSGEPRLVSSDGKHVIVRSMGAHSYVKQVEPTVAKTGIESGYNLQFGKTDPNIMYELRGTKIYKVVPNVVWSARASSTLLFDFATAKCLGVGFRPTWHGTFTIKDDDATFGTAFSNKGLQSTGNYTVSYNATDGFGCEVVDSLAGTVANAKWTLPADDGGNPAKPLVARFYLHEGGGGRDPKYVFLNATLRAFNGAKQISGCISGAGTCLIDRPYVHQRGTPHVVGCTENCDGHSAKGGDKFYTGKQQVGHPYGDPNHPTGPMVKFPIGFPDQHGAANSQNAPGDPIFMVSTDTTPAIPYPIWGYDEVLIVPTDGSLIVGRPGQTLNSGHPSEGFIGSNAVGVDGPDKHTVFFTSDMGGLGVLGKKADGTDRVDVFRLKF